MAETTHGSVLTEHLLCVVLAGGQGLRMGGVDKGLQMYQGRPLVEHVVDRLRSQRGGAALRIGINANRNLERYAALGYPVWNDSQEDYGGPLQGTLSSLQWAQQFPDIHHLLVVACDTPHLPDTLLERLSGAMKGSDASVAAVRASGRTHPLPCLLDTRVQASLAQYLAQGQRKVQTWMETCQVQWVDFETAPGASPGAFDNFNSLADLNPAGSR